MSRQRKRDKFKGQTKKESGNNKVFIGALVAGVAIIAGIFLFALNNEEANSPYNDRVVQQSIVNYEKEDGKIYVDERELDNKEFIKFEVDLNEPLVTQNFTGTTEFDYMPVTAYKGIDGEVVGALGLCEPCAGESLRIEGSNLVCNSCNTIWDLETFRGITGGCVDYPPVELTIEITAGKVVFDEEEIQSFEPRPL